MLNTNELKELIAEVKPAIRAVRGIIRPVIAGWLTGFTLLFVLSLLFHGFFLTFIVAPAAGFFLSFRLASGFPAQQMLHIVLTRGARRQNATTGPLKTQAQVHQVQSIEEKLPFLLG